MTAQQISQDVARGLELVATIKSAETELKSIEKRLESAGLEGEQIPLAEQDREGRQFLARCPQRGLIVPVIFESDQILGSIQQGTEIHQQLMKISNQHFTRFWKSVSKFERVQKEGLEYRKTARELLGTRAPDFIAASRQRDKNGIPKSRVIIAWDHAKPADQVAV